MISREIERTAERMAVLWRPEFPLFMLVNQENFSAYGRASIPVNLIGVYGFTLYDQSAAPPWHPQEYWRDAK